VAATEATFIDAPGPRRAGKVRETEHRQSAIMHTMPHRKDAVDDTAQRIDIFSGRKPPSGFHRWLA
jgi:hypothetical protein